MKTSRTRSARGPSLVQHSGPKTAPEVALRGGGIRPSWRSNRPLTGLGRLLALAGGVPSQCVKEGNTMTEHVRQVARRLTHATPGGWWEHGQRLFRLHQGESLTHERRVTDCALRSINYSTGQSLAPGLTGRVVYVASRPGQCRRFPWPSHLGRVSRPRAQLALQKPGRAVCWDRR